MFDPTLVSSNKPKKVNLIITQLIPLEKHDSSNSVHNTTH